jgi:type-F conjugative transfer system pilin assembly protein TrbC
MSKMKKHFFLVYTGKNAGSVNAVSGKNQVPVYFRGLVSDSMEKTAKYIQYLSSKYGVSGVQIDPVRFSEYQINNVPAYVEKCGAKI